jgi:rod shape-determining protein MreC
MLRRSQYVVGFLAAALALAALSLPESLAARLKLALGSLFLPLFGLVGAAQQTAEQAGQALLPRSELIRRNEALRRENERLRLQAMQAAAIARENERLREHLGWQQRHATWKLKLARVVLRDPANWWRTVQIDLGQRHGVRENLPVLTEDGLVGRIAAAGLLRSQVVLLGDPTCRVSAQVLNETRDTGVLGAAGPLDRALVELDYLPRSAVLQPGQAVVTSGLGGLFPAGIPIGQIVDWRPVESGLYLRARVRLAAHLSALEEVWVLLP